MLSRTAESIYWMSRYVERAENVARFLSVTLNLSLDLPGQAGEQWRPLIITTGDEQAFDERYPDSNQQNVIDFLTFDRENPNSILSCLRSAREAARGVREIISGEMWQHLNKFYLMVRDVGRGGHMMDDPHEFLEQINFSGQQFLGVTDATMTHGEAWHFCRLARLMERADKTSRILDVKYFLLLPKASDVGSPYDDIQWLALLRSASGLEMYRQRHGRVSPSGIVNFLILDNEFPRAVLFCLTRANESLHQISGSQVGGFSNEPEQLLGQLHSELAFFSAEDVIVGGLHEYVDRLQRELNAVGNAVHDAFFSLRPIEVASV